MRDRSPPAARLRRDAPLPGEVVAELPDTEHGEAAYPPAAPPIQADDPLGEAPAVFDGLDDGDASTLPDDLWLYAPSWLASTVVHLVLVLLLALLTTLTASRSEGPTLHVTVEGGSPLEAQAELLAAADLETTQPEESADPWLPAELAELPPTAVELGPVIPILSEADLPATGDLLDTAALLSGEGGSSLALRSNAELRAAMIQQRGGTPQSEAAVQRALRWLAEHQEYDGSWSFQHNKHPRCNAQCGNAGYTPGRIAATGMALLPFLGTGQTHRDGEHKDNIKRGLEYLVRAMQRQGDLGSLWDPHGTMYGHGLASIALCEAYGMTQDRTLRKPAQAAVNFIVEAQDAVGGGWRYHPNTPGDTSVVGWQLMALKSGQMAYLRVPPQTYRKAGYFLDSVQDQRGAVYGYQQPDGRRPTTSAIGLLSRMYLGWERNERGLVQGVRILSKLGPSTDSTPLRNNLYYNYYATQVLHHWGGSEWKRWNNVMRDYLVDSQVTQGHEEGSWYFDGSDMGSGAGGRLYCTAMSAMILEVYYRHMPLYREQSVMPQ